MLNYLVFVLLFAIGFASPPILGGWQDKPVTDESVKSISGKAVNKFGENGVDMKLLKICKAQSQLVAGMNYKIDMIVANEGSNDESTNQLCKFEAYVRAWEDFYEINNLTCDEKQKTCPE